MEQYHDSGSFKLIPSDGIIDVLKWAHFQEVATVRCATRGLLTCFLLTPLCHSDTFRFRDGRTLKGAWISGDGRTIRAEIGNNIQSLSAAELEGVFFDDAPPKTMFNDPFFNGSGDMVRWGGQHDAVGTWIGGDARTIRISVDGHEQQFSIGKGNAEWLVFCVCRSKDLAPHSSAPAPRPGASPRPAEQGNIPGPIVDLPPPPPSPPSPTALLRKLAKDFSKAMVAGNIDRVHQLATGTPPQFECVDIYTGLNRARVRFDDAATDRFGIVAVKARAEIMDMSVGLFRPNLPPDDATIIAEIRGDTAALRMPADNKTFANVRFKSIAGEWKVDLDSFVTNPQEARKLFPEFRAHIAALTVATERIRSNKNLYRDYDEAIRDYVGINSSFMLNPAFSIDGVGPIQR